MPSWFRTHGGFALSRTTNRSLAVEMWYADDLALVNNEAPNEASIFASFGLPPRGAPSNDPNLPGAICVGHKLVEPAVKIGTTARAKVAVFYDSDVRFRLTARYSYAVREMPPLVYDLPVVSLRSISSGSYVLRRPENAPSRVQWTQLITARTSTPVASIIAAANANAGRRYTIGGITHLLNGFGLAEKGDGSTDVTYAFYSNAAVLAVPSGTYGQHVALPALSNLDAYKVDEIAGTVGVKLAADSFPAGATLPGGVP